jgi:hypothetical protein
MMHSESTQRKRYLSLRVMSMASCIVLGRVEIKIDVWKEESEVLQSREYHAASPILIAAIDAASTQGIGKG